GGQTQSLVLREANTFIASLGQRADRLSDEELLQRFRPTLQRIGEQQQWMPAMSGLWIQRANGATIERAVRLTPTTMHRIREDVRHKHQRRTRAGGSRRVL
uniref:hypothetical protein n=1 Tax=Stomatohabitans albus TaxID=3110766 RepID=UPI00300CE4E7